MFTILKESVGIALEAKLFELYVAQILSKWEKTRDFRDGNQPSRSAADLYQMLDSEMVKTNTFKT